MMNRKTLPPSGKHMCACTSYASPRDFYLQLRDDGGAELRLLTRNLIQYVRSTRHAEIPPLLQPGSLVCAFQPSTGLAYRARVLPQTSRLSFVTVETLDFGERLDCSATDLLPLPDELADSMPPQAFRCRLAGVGTVWPEVASSNLAKRMLESAAPPAVEGNGDDQADVDADDDVKLWVEFPSATSAVGSGAPHPVLLSSEQGDQLNQWFFGLPGVQAEAEQTRRSADVAVKSSTIPAYNAASRLKVGQSQSALLCWLEVADSGPPLGRFILRDDRRHLRRLADKLASEAGDSGPARAPLLAGLAVLLPASSTSLPARRAILLADVAAEAGPEAACRLLLVDYGVEVVAKLADLKLAAGAAESTAAWSLTARLVPDASGLSTLSDCPAGHLIAGRLTVVSMSLDADIAVSFQPDVGLLPELLHAFKPRSSSSHSTSAATTTSSSRKQSLPLEVIDLTLPIGYPVRTPLRGSDGCVVLHVEHAASMHILLDGDVNVAKRIADRLSRYQRPADRVDNNEINSREEAASYLLAGSPCLAMDQRDGCWRRALVLTDHRQQRSDAGTAGQYLVRLVDTGRLAHLPASLIAPLPDSLAELPPCALHCSLADLQPGELAGPAALASLRKLVGRPAVVTFALWRPAAGGVQVQLEVNGRDVLSRLRQLRDQSASASISSSTRRQSNSSESSLHAQQKLPTAKQQPQLAQQQQRSQQEANQPKQEQQSIPMGDFPRQFAGVVCHARRIGPEELVLFAQQVDQQTRIEELHELLQERAAEQPPLSAAEQVVGAPCIALYEDDWYRARIVEPAGPDGRLRVQFVDYGNESVGSAADELRVRQLPSVVLSLPAQAAECHLRPPASRRFAEDSAAKLIALGEDDANAGIQLRLTSPRQSDGGWWHAEVPDNVISSLLE